MIKSILFFLLILSQALTTIAQTERNNQSIDTSQIDFTDPEIFAEFPGGETALICYIEKMMDSTIIHERIKKGKTVIEYTVDTLGQLKNIKILRSHSPIVDKEFVRIFKSMPNWTPGKIDGKPEEQTFYHTFTLPYEKNFCR